MSVSIAGCLSGKVTNGHDWPDSTQSGRPEYSSVEIVHCLACFDVDENAVARIGLLPWDVYSNKLCENSRSLFSCIGSDLGPLDELIAAMTEVVKPFTIPFGNMSVPTVLSSC
jgi:hypothetical protein